MSQHILVCPYTLDEIEEWKENARKYDRLKEAVGKIKDEIQRKANSGQWSEATIFGMQKAIAIIDKHLQEVENEVI